MILNSSIKEVTKYAAREAAKGAGETGWWGGAGCKWLSRLRTNATPTHRRHTAHPCPASACACGIAATSIVRVSAWVNYTIGFRVQWIWFLTNG